MTFGEKYFHKRNYSQKQVIVKRHVLEVLRWASKVVHVNLLDGHGKKALDVGCAYGFTTTALSEIGYETYGFDISDWGTKQAKTQKSTNFLICDAQSAFPFAAETFDIVTCFDVLEHLRYPEKTIKCMYEVSRGVVVCTTPNKKIEKPIRKITRDYDETHINVKTPYDWQKCLTNNVSSEFGVEAFYDVAVSLGGKLFFKSFCIPAYGLTLRIVIKK